MMPPPGVVQLDHRAGKPGVPQRHPTASPPSSTRVTSTRVDPGGISSVTSALLPPEREHNALVGHELERPRAWIVPPSARSTQQMPPRASGRRPPLRPPPVAHAVGLGPVPPHGLRMRLGDAHGLLDDARLSFVHVGSFVCARAILRVSAATLSRARCSDHISSTKTPRRGRPSAAPVEAAVALRAHVDQVRVSEDLRCCDTAGRLIAGKCRRSRLRPRSPSCTRRRIARRWDRRPLSAPGPVTYLRSLALDADFRVCKQQLTQLGGPAMEPLEALDRTFQHAQQVMADVPPDQYDNPTPCPEWTVRRSAEHQIGVVAGSGAAAAGRVAPNSCSPLTPVSSCRR